MEDSDLKIVLPEEFSDYDFSPQNLALESETSPEETEYAKNSAAHEAGYDALMTGTVFVRALKKLNLIEDLKKGVTFEKLSTYRNRLPLGGIKTPFNLASDTDFYSSPSEQVFHCYCVTRTNLKLAEIMEIIRSNFGDMSESILYGDTIEFFFNLVKEEQMKEL